MRPIPQGVAVVVPQDGMLLVIRRSAAVRAPRAFCVPGGGIEVGEVESEAVVREMQEELGVLALPERLLWRSTTPWGFGMAWWLCRVESVDFQINPREVESVHWFVPSEIERLPGLLESNRQFFQAWRAGLFTLPIDPTSSHPASE